MTAEGAGVSERERLARTILDALKDEETQQQDWGPAYVSDDSPASKPLTVVTVDGQVDLTAVVSAILSAGFGDVAKAKAEALEAAASLARQVWTLAQMPGNQMTAEERQTLDNNYEQLFEVDHDGIFVPGWVDALSELASGYRATDTNGVSA